MTTFIEPDRRSLRPGDVLLCGLWLGLLAGCIEAAGMLFRKHVIGRQTFLGPDVVWMAPVADLLWLVIPSAAMALLVALGRSPRATRAALFGVAFPAAVLVTFLAIIELHTYALLLLAVGIAVQFSAVTARQSRSFLQLVRRSFPVLAAVPLAGFLVVRVGAGFRDDREVAGLPQARGSHPNVLLLVLDTARSLSMSTHGYPRPTTPELESLARRGINFLAARAPSSWTLPSHASMFTGRLPHELSTGFRTPLDRTYPTLAEALRDNGYETAGFIANIHYVGRDFGLDRGFIRYDDYAISPGELLLNSSVGRYLAVKPRFRELLGYYDIFARKSAADINASLLSWLDGREPTRPFFAFVNYYDVHEPYLPPPEYERRFASPVKRKSYLTDQSMRGARRMLKLDMTPAEVNREHDAYAGAMAYLDHEIGLLLDEMEERGLLENTLVIVTSDHGEQFGEHGMFVHGNSVYRPATGVPLIMALPGRIPSAMVSREPLNLSNLAMTVLDLAGVDDTAGFAGASLRPYWESADSLPDEPVLMELVTNGEITGGGVQEEVRGVLLGDYEYIRHEDGREELYYLADDPNELLDLAGSEEARPRLAALRATMDSILEATGEDRWPVDW